MNSLRRPWRTAIVTTISLSTALTLSGCQFPSSIFLNSGSLNGSVSAPATRTPSSSTPISSTPASPASTSTSISTSGTSPAPVPEAPSASATTTTLVPGTTTSEPVTATTTSGESNTSASPTTTEPAPSEPAVDTDPEFFDAPLSYALLVPSCFSPGNLEGAYHSIIVRNVGHEAGAVFVARTDGDGAVGNQPDLYGEVQHIGPGTFRTLRVALPNGHYRMYCTIDEIPAKAGEIFVVTSSDLDSAPHAAAVDYDTLRPAAAGYSNWIRTEQFPHVVTAVDELRAALASGDVEAAKREWKKAHHQWHMMSNFAPVLDDYSDDIDGIGRRLRHSDIANVHGFHRIEWELWNGDTAAALSATDELVDTLAQAQEALKTTDISVVDLGLRTHEALEETERFTLAERDDFGSHTAADVYAADIEGTQQILRYVGPILKPRMSNYDELEQQLNDSLARARAWDSSDLGSLALSQWPYDERGNLNASLAGDLQLIAPTASLLLPRRTQE